jgi:predicted amidohydrolase YtcJ
VTPGVLIRQAELTPGECRDVRVVSDTIAEIADNLAPREGERCLDAKGGALLPGLHDHHIHLYSAAAAQRSIACGPPAVSNEQELAAALLRGQEDSREGWLRGIGYHESVAGSLDRARLDALLPGDRPLRVQHRSGALWILNSAAIANLGLDDAKAGDGVERDASGRATGRIYYQDVWLRGQLRSRSAPDLAPLSRQLSRYGVTGVTDATPDKQACDYLTLAESIARGELSQRLVAMGGLSLPDEALPFELGALKIMLREPALPEFDSLVDSIRRAHAQERPVAFHCVTRSELVMAAEAVRAAGGSMGDRIEHASIAPPELVELLAELSLCVVTQPGFIWERGDDYARDVAAEDRPWLYRGDGFLRAGVPLAAGTDAPYGDPDPWRAMRAAVKRKSRAGRHIGEAEALTPERALALFTTHPDAPGGCEREVAVGLPADLCLLDRPWCEARERLVHDDVRVTWVAGERIWLRDRSASEVSSRA